MNVARRQELQTALLGTFNLRNGVDLTAKAALPQEKRSIAVNEERCEGGKAEKRKGGKAGKVGKSGNSNSGSISGSPTQKKIEITTKKKENKRKAYFIPGNCGRHFTGVLKAHMCVCVYEYTGKYSKL